MQEKLDIKKKDIIHSLLHDDLTRTDRASLTAK